MTTALRWDRYDMIDTEDNTSQPTILDIAIAWGAQSDPDGGINGGEFERLGLPIMGGCQFCGASIAAYNAYPGTNGYLVGACCVGDGSATFDSIAEFEAWFNQADEEEH